MVKIDKDLVAKADAEIKSSWRRNITDIRQEEHDAIEAIASWFSDLESEDLPTKVTVVGDALKTARVAARQPLVVTDMLTAEHVIRAGGIGAIAVLLTQNGAVLGRLMLAERRLVAAGIDGGHVLWLTNRQPKDMKPAHHNRTNAVWLGGHGPAVFHETWMRLDRVKDLLTAKMEWPELVTALTGGLNFYPQEFLADRGYRGDVFAPMLFKESIPISRFWREMMFLLGREAEYGCLTPLERKPSGKGKKEAK